jgi:hypothetical protein
VFDGFGIPDLTGRWLGFYRYRSEEMGLFPITAEIRQEGSRIAGEMYDQVTERTGLLERLLELCREDITPWQRSKLERAMAQVGTREIEVRTHLPDAADLKGRIAGDRVEFTKAYRGPVGVYWFVGGTPVGSGERERHCVHYSGQLDSERGMIAGHWTIRRPGLLGRFLPPQARGTFELYKKT